MAYKESDPTLKKAADDEPIFVLRAKDKLAPIVVETWAMIAKLMGVSEDKITEATDCAIEMYRWQDKNGCKIPD